MEEKHSLLESKTVSLPTTSMSSSSPRTFFASNGIRPSLSIFAFLAKPILIGWIPAVDMLIDPDGTGAVVKVCAGPVGALAGAGGGPAKLPRNIRKSVVISGEDPSSGGGDRDRGMTWTAPACSDQYAHHAPSGWSMVALPIPPFRDDRSRY